MAIRPAELVAPSDDKRWRIVETRMRRTGQRPDALIEVLHAAQEAFGYLDPDALEFIGGALGVPLSKVYGVATFYSFFTLKPHGQLHQRRPEDPRRDPRQAGRRAARDHRGRQALRAHRALPRGLQPRPRDDPRRRGPREAHARRRGRATGGAVTETAGERRPARRRHRQGLVPEGPARASAHVCQAASCLSAQSDLVSEALTERVVAAGLGDVAVKRVGCLGLCAAGPLVEVPETGELFERVSPGELDGLVAALGAVQPGATRRPQPPFFARQLRIATENSGRIDPESRDDYLANRGYAALRKAVTAMTPAEVRDEVTRSGLRGRGGAGYPTGLKWTTVVKAPGEPKYVICNADEGDPGAFMDRSVLESDPHRVLEGMAIAGYAVGAR